MIIVCKWVFKRKLGSDGQMERYKAHPVAQGYAPVQGLYFNETFSLLVRFESVKAVLALAVKRRMQVQQMDVATAFLDEELEKDGR